jgi:hypothetical protein
MVGATKNIMPLMRGVTSIATFFNACAAGKKEMVELRILSVRFTLGRFKVVYALNA